VVRKWAGDGHALSRQLLGRDRQIADPLAGGAINRVGDCRRDAAERDLGKAFRAQRIEGFVL
jgi:hypothetical protein